MRERLAHPLPGHDGFREVSGYDRPDLESIKRQVPPPKESGVLALLYPHQGELHTMLMLRPAYDGVHSGQVGFPGGHREPGDADIIATALREFEEETGARTDGVEVLGTMTPVYIPPSRALVTPVLAYSDLLGPLRPDPREVAALIPTAITHLLRDDILKRTTVYVSILKREMEVPYWDVDGHVVWGATALMIAEMRDLLKS
ncbi:MAG: CoA pyrophosphatase [Flavobacteriales bacterium]|nr:CoA pyrophosphatase [Flavobacteriales bacterium]